MFVDWEQLVGAPEVRYLAAAIRERWGAWVGVVDPLGAIVPLGKDGGGGGPKLCEAFLANPGAAGGSCVASVNAWGAQGIKGQRLGRCHAGLDAIFSPVMIRGELVGTVFASGVVMSADRYERQQEVQTKYAMIGEDMANEEIKLNHLTASDQEALRTLLNVIAKRLGELGEGVVSRQPRHATRFGGMIGASGPMLRLFSMIERVARTSSTALVLGENGTGKELIAKAIHEHSRRQKAPFITQNCAAIPAELMESELFGHKRGAFSGAHRDRRGLFEVAHNGTFFLDEIGEMDLALQAKMLRVLQEGTFLPVGDTVFRKVDVRIICATNRDLEEMVRQGTFRQDLYYRINVITVSAPPLRERPSDIPLLVEHFIHKAARTHGLNPKPLTRACLDVLMRYAWPGNVRQLENELERTLILSGELPEIDAEQLSASIRGQNAIELSLGALSQLTMPEAIELLERRMILDSLEESGWNKTQSAKRLGVSRRNLIRKVASYELGEDSQAEDSGEYD